jgi:hypothetical protein
MIDANRMSLSPEEEFARLEQETKDAMSVLSRATGVALPEDVIVSDEGLQ